MARTTELPDVLSARLQGLAERSGRSVADILREALEKGHSLGWQEHFHARVDAGLACADARDFATDAEIEVVRGKWGRDAPRLPADRHGMDPGSRPG